MEIPLLHAYGTKTIHFHMEMSPVREEKKNHVEIPQASPRPCERDGKSQCKSEAIIFHAYGTPKRSFPYENER